MAALYNEIDNFAADWLENLIAAGHIAPGIVDRRSIVDISPSDLKSFRQVHFFAGIGVWSYALRRAGWPDDRSLWTGSCPCQPFSAAGKGGGFDDERHLWPHFHYLIEQCRPPIVLGEQVASKDGLAWLDLVQSDLEGTGYACGAVDTCSASVGAPHIRQRLRFAAVRLAQPDQGQWGPRRTGAEPTRRPLPEPAGPSAFSQLGNADRTECTARNVQRGGAATRSERVAQPSPPSQLVDADGRDRGDIDLQRGGQHGLRPQDGISGGSGHQGIGHNRGPELERPCPTNGFWSNPDWLYCRDGKWRPVESGTFPLAHGAPARVGRLRAYGNAVDAEATREFCEAVLSALD